MTNKKFWVATGHNGAEDSPVWGTFEYMNGSDFVRCFDSEVAAGDEARRLNGQMWGMFAEDNPGEDIRPLLDAAPGFSVQEGDPLMLFYGWNFPCFNGASVQAMEAAGEETEMTGHRLIAFRAARDPDGGYADDGSIDVIYDAGDGEQLTATFAPDGRCTKSELAPAKYARRIDAIRAGWTASDDWK